MHTASEYRSWALYYAYPVLQSRLQEDYLRHFMCFSEALWLLLQVAPTATQICKAEILLDKFCFQFHSLYGMIHKIQFEFF